MRALCALEGVDALTTDERNMLSVGYKNVIGTRRASWRILNSIEEKERGKGHEAQAERVRAYRARVEKELKDICADVLEVLDGRLLSKASGDGESVVFYLKMKADYYRYLAEVSSGDEREEASKNADEALKLAKEYRSKTIADMCGEVPNSDSGLCKNTSSTSGTYTDTIQPDSLIKGLDVNNVTPSPIYYEPGTVKYGGLGYNPSYTDINYMNNKFTTKPEIVNQFNKKGFCDLSNNMMENINEKCENLPKGV